MHHQLTQDRPGGKLTVYPVNKNRDGDWGLLVIGPIVLEVTKTGHDPESKGVNMLLPKI